MDISTARNYRLSENFTLLELLHTDISSFMPAQLDVSEKELLNLKRLCDNILQPLRDHIAEPITVTSGFRSRGLNIRLGGVAYSQHRLGEAVDFQCIDMDNAFEFIRNSCTFDQVIDEYRDGKHWIHVSVRMFGNRMEVLRYNNGNYTKLT